jgi:hypothetical protein
VESSFAKEVLAGEQDLLDARRQLLRMLRQRVGYL